ncbi:ABC transporter substrate-binding protein [Rhizobium sp. SEMIA 4085]|uniref:Oligopeptide/dipeptide ABC transporter substrate-binding protein n=1 Tax=Rhizobium gallicum bv. gallicum R602sp TaxID=1041138 RepID=A0A0B4XAD3_9HYPH|nr:MULTISPECIES: ABC transporter substrate-binding protein [Rhizobium]AJD44066.1 oligopeptide/dipeptide ABC transporter substrate-binding protein [Rhizobium gallicum bv. gallicum R602sp]NNH29862.1 ABC transporter substrate-binding protein [Rhizobium sp. SEMIA 4085]
MKKVMRINNALSVGLALLLASGTAIPVCAASDALTVVVTDEPKSLDPCDTDLSGNSRILHNNITEALVNLNPVDGSVVPSLATSWRQLDNLTWEFTLREGVTFHDGKPFDANAVVAALKRAQDPALACESGLATLKGVKFDAQALTSTTLLVKTDIVEPILPNKMSAVDIGSPATPNDGKTRSPAGTGPYRLAAWTPGQSISLAAFDGYWGEKPAIKNATIIWRAESAVRAAMVDTAEAQIAYEIAPQDGITEQDHAFPNAETSLLRIDAQVPPLNDMRVREALNLAIDRDGLVGTIFHEGAQKAMQVVSPSVFGFNPDLPVWKYNPEKARSLLAAAKADGVPVDKEIVIYGRIGIYPNSSESLEAIQAMLADAGFNARLEMLETSPWLKRLLKPWDKERQPSILQTQIDNTEGDAVFTLPNRFTTDGNQSTIADPKLDKLITDASRATGDERRTLFQEAFKYIAVDAVNIAPLFHMVSIARVAKNVNYTPDVQAGNEIKLKSISYR